MVSLASPAGNIVQHAGPSVSSGKGATHGWPEDTGNVGTVYNRSGRGFPGSSFGVAEGKVLEEFHGYAVFTPFNDYVAFEFWFWLGHVYGCSAAVDRPRGPVSYTGGVFIG